MSILAGAAEPLIEFLIGAKWLPSVSYLQLLCIVGALYPIHAINVSVAMALGHSQLVLNLNLVKNLIRFIVLLATFRFGIIAIILGQILSSVISLWINAYYTRKLLHISFWQQFSRFVYPCLLAALVFGGSFAASHLQLTPVAVRLLFSVTVGVCAGLIGFYFVRNYVRDEAGILAQQIPRLAPLHRFLYQNQTKRCR